MLQESNTTAILPFTTQSGILNLNPTKGTPWVMCDDVFFLIMWVATTSECIESE